MGAPAFAESWLEAPTSLCQNQSLGQQEPTDGSEPTARSTLSSKCPTLAGINPIRRTRAGDGHISLYGRRLVVHLMVQPGVARVFIADPMAADTGFLPRFLVCEPPSTIGGRLHRDVRPDEASLEAFAARLSFILETPMPMDAETRELTPRTLALSSGARELLIRFSDTVERLQAKGQDLAHITGTASKAAEQAARIAGVLTLWRDLNAIEVQPSDMADAITLAQFYLSEASRLASAATISAETDRAETMRRWLVETWPHDEVTLRETVQYGPNALRESSKALAALRILEQYGWLAPLDPGTEIRGAARKQAWRVVRDG